MDLLSEFQPEKLSIEFIEGTTDTHPIIPRRYTLTHSDHTGDLFLTIGHGFAWDNINPLRDEVLGEWIFSDGTLKFLVYLYIDRGEVDPSVAARRVDIFKHELPLALHAIKYGDRNLFDTYPSLLQSPILVHFMSAYPEFARQEIWGSFKVKSISKTKGMSCNLGIPFYF
ncbi:staygreen family protein [Oceanobacillus luteolus]|uniref:staygreen family protein n=1 Tax=Oceanobacillus luteolus TaxID=1274358 RepID=UPI0032E7FEB7